MQDLRLGYEWVLISPRQCVRVDVQEGWQYSACAECDKAFAKTNGAGVRIVIAGLPAPP